ncbi:MAG: M24 family metallopeptidase [Leclercia adecarboxylata]|nr:M24 family metallopeptidase [Leclercia adecarboxylata]
MPSILIKSADELARQRHAGELLASVFTMLDEFIKPGVSTMEINNRAEAFIVDQLQSRPASKGQYGYPYVLNTSVNDVVCHGIPKESEHLKSGSIVNVDITLENAGMIADSSKMYLIGEVSPLARRLVKTTQEGMVFTIEPMINQGDSRIKTKKDGWTVVTRDKKLSAQWEHTIAVTADGFEVLTLRPDETIPD